VKEALAAGATPVFAFEPSLAAAVAEKLDAENRLSAARLAVEVLGDELLTAESAEKIAKAGVTTAAIGVEDAIIARIHAELKIAEANAFGLRCLLKSKLRCTASGQSSPTLKLAQSYMNFEAPPLDSFESPNTLASRKFSDAFGAWQAFRSELLKDAAAAFRG
jgi:hypothetical protein